MRWWLNYKSFLHLFLSPDQLRLVLFGFALAKVHRSSWPLASLWHRLTKLVWPSCRWLEFEEQSVAFFNRAPDLPERANESIQIQIIIYVGFLFVSLHWLFHTVHLLSLPVTPGPGGMIIFSFYPQGNLSSEFQSTWILFMTPPSCSHVAELSGTWPTGYVNPVIQLK